MTLALLLAKQIVSMMLMLMIGFVVMRIGLLPKDTGKVLSALVLYVFCPAILLSSFRMEFSTRKLAGLMIATVAAFAAFVLFRVLSRLLADPCHLNKIDRMSAIYPNTGNLIIPLVAAVLGGEYVFYCCAYLSAMNVMSWVHADRVIGEKEEIKVRKILLNPNILAIVIGLFLFVTGMPLPEILWDTAEKVGNAIGPASMLSIGALMSETDLKQIFCRRKPYVISFLRLLLFPLVFILLLWVVGPERIFPGAGQVLIATVLAASAPTAVFVTQFAALYEKDTTDASAANVLSTLLCVFSLPVMIVLYQALCL